MNLAYFTFSLIHKALPDSKSAIYPNVQKSRKLPLSLRFSIRLNNALYNFANKARQNELQDKALDYYYALLDKFDSFYRQYHDTVPKDLQKSIIKSSLSQLVDQLKSGKLTSEQIVITYCLRCCKVGKSLNLITFPMFDEAIEEARRKDEERAKLSPGQELPPLHGIPFSVKDQVKCKGASHFLAISTEDSAFVGAMRKLGAIPIAITNVPQGLWGIAADNNAFGLAANPWNVERATGGSSGGEGGMIASRCSPIGIATDAIGSVRIPASWCGCHSFRATYRRVSKIGRFSASGSELDIFREVDTVVGTIGLSMDDVVFLQKSLFSNFYEFDPFTANYPFDEKLYQKGLQKSGLNIGYLIETENFEVHTGIKNCMNQTVEKLREQGHNLVELNIGKDLETLNQLLMCAVFALGPEVFLNNNLKGEKPVPQAYFRHLTGALPNWINKRFVAILRVNGEDRLADQFEWYVRKNNIQIN